MYDIEPKIIDNFLSKTYHAKILNFLTSNDFSWNFEAGTSNELQEYGFSHIFWEQGIRRHDSDFITPFIYQAMDAAECDFILRASADMITWSKKDEYIHPAHTDYSDPNISSIYYVNETDGDTILYNDVPRPAVSGAETKIYKRVSPKPNRLLIHSGHLLHSRCSPSKHKNRILINGFYLKRECVDQLHNMPKHIHNLVIQGQ